MSSPEQRDLPRRWRLVLGPAAATSYGMDLHGDEQRLDEVLGELYDAPDPAEGADRRGGLGSSAPRLARWLGDIRRYFPSSVVRLMQKDALERWELQRLLLEPELLAAAEPDIHLAAALISLNRAMPARTRATARLVVQRLVDQLLRRLELPLRSAVKGALGRSVQRSRPRAAEIDWQRTIRANLQRYQKELGTIIPERILGRSRRGKSLRDIILCIDQSGSMATSVVYASVFGAVLASLPAVATRMIVFDTAVADLSAELRDPVDLLFGAQLGGGTDIHRALVHCESLVQRPRDTVLVLISDLCEGGDSAQMLKTAQRLIESGVQLIVLLALSDEGRPAHDARHAGLLAALGAPVFACTPDLFPDLMAAALARKDLELWAAGKGVRLERSSAT
ncbi:MAG: VWA domain-containing protein [Planctomycetes bacterium]|nr:VWA domain-containing protein [Planctomycetota bacterium]